MHKEAHSLVLAKERPIRQQQRPGQDSASLIRDLESRNQRLRIQIQKIRETMKSIEEEGSVKLPHKLVTIESTPEAMKKELENAYQQVKMYEREIAKLEAKQQGGPLSEKMTRLESIVLEKDKVLEKLRADMTSLGKSTNDNSKKLKDNSAKDEIQSRIIKLNQEIKYLREKVREAEGRERRKHENAKKQETYIRNLEERIVAIAGQSADLECLRKNNIFVHIFQKNLAERRAKSTLGNTSVVSAAPVQEKTLQKFQQLKNEIKLFKKLHVDYQKKIEDLRIGKLEIEQQMEEAKSELAAKQQQVESMENEARQLKGKVNKANLKPAFSVSEAGPGSQAGKRNAQNKKQFVAKMKSRSTQEPLPMPPHLKFDEKGNTSEKSMRFSDRGMLGKIFNARVTGVRVWVEKNTFAICGVQCVYLVPSTGKSKIGGEFLKGGKEGLSEMKFECAPGDYLKTVSGAISSASVIEYLVFISRESKIARFGAVRPGQKQFTFDIEETELPVCIYGAYEQRGDKPYSALTFLGFEIAKDDIPPPPL